MPSSNRSYQPSIIRQVIMLPLHGQSTAAVKKFHWAGPTLYVWLTESHVFAKQARHGLPNSFLLIKKILQNKGRTIYKGFAPSLYQIK